jgi:hypothetical protein
MTPVVKIIGYQHLCLSNKRQSKVVKTEEDKYIQNLESILD